MKIWASVFVIWAGLMLTLAAFGPSLAASNPGGYFVENEHSFVQDVSGDGYAMVYQKVNTETLQLQNYMHGSGSLDSATLLNSSQAEESYYKFDPDTGQ
ncbi:MAG: hypothetical protein AB7V64_09420 [Methanothrix sp.]